MTNADIAYKTIDKIIHEAAIVDDGHINCVHDDEGDAPRSNQQWGQRRKPP